jgi:chorismate dehydratase
MKSESVVLDRELVRIGSVPYLNAAPLVHGLGSGVRLAPPSQLAEWLRSGEIDVGLVSIAEVLENDCYDVVDGIGVGSDGPVYSVLLAHRVPLSELRTVACDPASLTSVRLLQWLFAERGLRPEFVRMAASTAPDPDATEGFLLIGDPAIAFRQSAAASAFQIWDLGQAWRESTGLPFVYAVWAIRRDVEAAPLVRRLLRAHDQGMAALDEIVRSRPEFDSETRDRYLRLHIRYSIGERERRGMAAFASGLDRLEIVRTHPIRWIGVHESAPT